MGDARSAKRSPAVSAISPQFSCAPAGLAGAAPEPPSDGSSCALIAVFLAPGRRPGPPQGAGSRRPAPRAGLASASSRRPARTRSITARSLGTRHSTSGHAAALRLVPPAAESGFACRAGFFHLAWSWRNVLKPCRSQARINTVTSESTHAVARAATRDGRARMPEL